MDQSLTTERVNRSERCLPSLIILIPLLSVVLVAAMVSYIFISNHHEFQALEAELVGNAVRDQSQANIQREVERAIDQLKYNHLQAEQQLRTLLIERTNSAVRTIETLYDQYAESLSGPELKLLISESLSNFYFADSNSYYVLFSEKQGSSEIIPLLPLSRSTRASIEQEHLLISKLKTRGRGFFRLAEAEFADEKLLYIERFESLGLIIATVERIGRFRAQLQTQALDRLRDYRFGKDGYLFVYSDDGRYLMNPHSPALAGRRVDTINDVDGKPIWEEFLAAANAPEGRFVRYRWTRPGSDIPVDKLTFAKPYSQWGWVIATGVYVDDMVQAAEADQQALNERMGHTLERTMIIVVAMLVFTFLVTLLIARYTSRLLRRYHQQLLHQNAQLSVWNTRLEHGIAQRTQELELKNRELNRLSTTDALTGLSNRLRLDQFFEKVLNGARRYDRVFSVVLMDLDRFKNINDTWGHQIGDQVLIKVGQLIEDSIRDADIVGRWGGEEFLVILPETGPDQAETVAESLRKRIADIELESVPVVTCSFGVTSYRDGDSAERMLARADEALYQAKRQGRNLVETG